MIAARSIALACAMLAATSALANQPAKPISHAHVEVHPFVQDEVVRFAVSPGYQSTIAFAAGERIENVAIGDSGAWQVTPNRRADLLFVKPTAATVRPTNLTVVTDQHTYLLELRLALRETPVYLLRFAYPEPDAGATPAAIAAPTPAPAAATAPQPTELNFSWAMTGDRTLYPERVFDDGSSVFLAWSAGRALPAVLVIGPDGKTEGPVNFTTHDEYLVVDGFHDRLVLRSGKSVAMLATSRTAPTDRSPHQSER